MYPLKQENKRKFERVGIRTPVRYQVRGEADFDNSVSENISLGGMCFTSNRMLGLTTPVMLEVNVLSRVLHPIGKVVWSSALPRSSRNRLGIEFLEFNSTEKSYLSDYINMRTSFSMPL